MVQLHSVEEILLLEDIHPPLLFSGRLACFCWFVVFENSVRARNSVGLLGKQTSGLPVRFLLLGQRFASLGRHFATELIVL